jgi:acyl-ACP thioesterase
MTDERAVGQPAGEPIPTPPTRDGRPPMRISDFGPHPGRGRRFEASATARASDCDPDGRLRLDGLARLLQDAADDDLRDAGLDAVHAWALRRTELWVAEPARFGARLSVVTWCAGLSGPLAVRRSDIFDQRGVLVASAEATWVVLGANGRPGRPSQSFLAVYGPSAAGGHPPVRRLTLPPPTRSGHERPWPTRWSDADPFRHLNNAVSWAALEDLRLSLGLRPLVGWAIAEHRQPVPPGTRATLLADLGPDQLSVWLCDDRGEPATALQVVLPADTGRARPPDRPDSVA